VGGTLFLEDFGFWMVTKNKNGQQIDEELNQQIPSHYA
jgi:hypothetical protein